MNNGACRRVDRSRMHNLGADSIGGLIGAGAVDGTFKGVRPCLLQLVHMSCVWQ